VRKRIYIFVNGILCNPGNADHWTDRAVTWIHTNTPYRAEKFEYWSNVTTRLLGQERRARTLAKMLSFYPSRDWEVVLVGHSNGCDVVARALRIIHWEEKTGQQFEQVHLYAPAIVPSAGIPILTDIIGAGALFKLLIHIGGLDKLLIYQERFGRFLKRLRIPYGAIGGMNPDKLAFLFGVTRARVVSHPAKGHSTYFDRGRPFEETMKEIVKT